MKRLSSVVLAAAALCMVAAPSAKAQGTLRYGVSAGLLMPTGNYHTGDKMGWVAGAGATYWLPVGNVGVRADVSYSQTSHDSATTGFGGHTKMIGGMASAVYALNPANAPARIILSAGLGLYNVKIDLNGLSGSSTKVGFGGGAAVAFKLGAGSTRLVIASRYQSVSTSPSLNFIPLTVGLSFGK